MTGIAVEQVCRAVPSPDSLPDNFSYSSSSPTIIPRPRLPAATVVSPKTQEEPCVLDRPTFQKFLEEYKARYEARHKRPCNISDEETVTLYELYKLGRRNAENQGRTCHIGLSSSKLRRVDGGRMERQAALHFSNLLDDARLDLEAAKSTGEAPPTAKIGLGSGYRSLKEDFDPWIQAALIAMQETKSEFKTLDLNSEKAIDVVSKKLAGRKATFGYSLHSYGLAADLMGFDDRGNPLEVGNNKAWKGTWFHNWLTTHAHEYGFYPISSERWHWEYRGTRQR